jgi:hypothetical protein
VAPNHAETQGARGDMKACGPWKGSCGRGRASPISSLRVPSPPFRISFYSISASDLLASVRFLSSSALFESHRLTSNRFFPFSPPSHTTQRPADQGSGRGEAWGPINSALVTSYQLLSPRFSSYLVFSFPYWSHRLLSYRVGSRLIVPQAPQRPAESWKAKSDHINSDQIPSCFTYPLESDLFPSNRFYI